MKWLRQHLAALSIALRRFLQAPLATLFTALAVGVAITLPAALYLSLKNLDHLAGNLPAQPEISLFLSPQASAAERDDIKRTLEQRQDLSQLRFVSSQQALTHLNQQGLTDLTAGLEQNPLPDAWILTPRQTTPAAMESLRQQLRTLPGVESVLADSTWAARLQAILHIGERAVLLLAALFGLALAAIAGNAIRSQILSRRDEIEVSRLIGATDRYIRRPFLYFGALQGVAGALGALVILTLLGLALNGPISQLANLYGSPFRLIPLGLTETGLVLASATLFSWLGAWIAVSHTLQKFE